MWLNTAVAAIVDRLVAVWFPRDFANKARSRLKQFRRAVAVAHFLLIISLCEADPRFNHVVLEAEGWK